MVKQYYFKYCPFICIFKVSSLLSPSWPKHVAQSSKFCHPVDLSPRWHRSHSAAVKRGNFPVGQSQFCPRGAHCSRRRPLLSSSSFNGVQPALAQSSPPARDDWTHRATRRRPPTKQSQRRAVSSPAGRYVYRQSTALWPGEKPVSHLSRCVVRIVTHDKTYRRRRDDVG